MSNRHHNFLLIVDKRLGFALGMFYLHFSLKFPIANLFQLQQLDVNFLSPRGLEETQILIELRQN